MEQSKDTKEKQLSLELHEPISNKFQNVKGKINKSLRIFEVKKFARSWAVWFSLIFTIAAIFIQVYYLLTAYSTLPTIVPALKMFVTLNKILINKEFLFGYPMASIAIFTTSFYISYTTHSKNNVAALTILLLTTTSIIVFTYSLIQLIAIYNV